CDCQHLLRRKLIGIEHHSKRIAAEPLLRENVESVERKLHHPTRTEVSVAFWPKWRRLPRRIRRTNHCVAPQVAAVTTYFLREFAPTEMVLCHTESSCCRSSTPMGQRVRTARSQSLQYVAVKLIRRATITPL